MSTLRCEACGAPLSAGNGCGVATCKYCGTETIIEQTEPKNFVMEVPVSNSLVLSIPSCGTNLFQKRTFNIYQNYAELVDAITGRVDQHIDFQKVAKYHPMLGTNIIFKMFDGQKIMIKCLWNRKAKIALYALNGLIGRDHCVM